MAGPAALPDGSHPVDQQGRLGGRWVPPRWTRVHTGGDHGAMSTEALGSRSGRGRRGRWWWSPAAWTWVALVMALLMGTADPGSGRRWWLIPLLLATYLALWHTRGRRAVVTGRGLAAAVFVSAGLLGGVAFELGLDAGGGAGGLDEDALTSFLLLPGYLVPAVAFTWWATRRFGLDARQVFLLAGAMSWYEAATVGGAAMLATPWLAVPLVAFYVASYAVYNGAIGLLLVDAAALHGPRVRPLRPGGVVLAGVLGGAGAWAAFTLWSLVVT